MQRLSAVVITHNEERDIGRTLERLVFADELVVVDSHSTDRTIEICATRGARVVTHPFGGFGAQKRFAVEQAANDWVLCVDADEIVTAELASAIRSALHEAPPRHAAYRLRFRTVFMGQTLRHGTRETHVRLFDRRRAAWTDAAIHESVVVNGTIGDLPGHVLHESARDVAEAIEKLNAYTSISATGRGAGRFRGSLALIATGAYHFFRHWVLRRQILNGIPGFAVSMLFAVGSVVKHLKAGERARERDGFAVRAEVTSDIAHSARIVG